MTLEEAQAGQVVAHIDLDAFYVAVEVRRAPHLAGKPVGVVQYNPLGDLQSFAPDDPRRHMNGSNGSLIAVSYQARALGVKRNMRGDEARKLCAKAGVEMQLVQVPTSHGKADLTLYRQTSKQVMDVLSRLSICERASIDECYLDISAEAARRMAATSGNPLPPADTDRIHVAGQAEGGAGAWWTRPAEAWGCGERLLAAGAAAIADLRAAVLSELGFTTSAGVAHNKILAKLASGMHKPSQQTLVPLAAVPALLAPLPIARLRQLGGKFGEQLVHSLDKKLRLLCLHGYMQNAEVFRARIGSLRKALKSRADLVFVEGPHAITATDSSLAAEAGAGSLNQRAWWSWQDTASAARPSLSARYSGWEASRCALTGALEDAWPVDGILGFSQGATAAAILLADLAKSRPDLLPAFCILVGAFLPRDPSMAQRLQDGQHAVPVLMVHGRSDTLVPLERSMALREAMGVRSKLFVHGGAHLVPTCTGDFKRALTAFLDRHGSGAPSDAPAAGAADSTADTTNGTSHADRRSSRAPSAAAAAGAADSAAGGMGSRNDARRHGSGAPSGARAVGAAGSAADSADSTGDAGCRSSGAPSAAPCAAPGAAEGSVYSATSVPGSSRAVSHQNGNVPGAAHAASAVNSVADAANSAGGGGGREPSAVRAADRGGF